MTGFGQEGPLARAAGHDINYIALAGALNAIGPKGHKPVPPLNLVGDFGGGGMYLAFGIACALLERERSGKGQVVDAAMVDGAASLMTIFFGMRAEGLWRDERGVNVIDSGAHFYDTYETADGKYVSVGSIEPKFYAELLRLGGLEGENLPSQFDQDHWPEMSERLARLFKSKSRDEWCEIMEGSDACFAPVLSFDEVAGHPHNRARETFVEVDRVLQPAPAPRFSRSEAKIQGPPARRGQHTEAALADWGIERAEIETLMGAGVIAG
jgi:alpha-methylacyl-CoA racemase